MLCRLETVLEGEKRRRVYLWKRHYVLHRFVVFCFVLTARFNRQGCVSLLRAQTGRGGGVVLLGSNRLAGSHT